MNVKHITPILNVSNLQQSFAWFENLGWKKGFEWGSPPTFGSVSSGHFEIFLCQGGQGGRGKGANATTFGGDTQTGDKGVWMSIWVDDVDAVHQQSAWNRASKSPGRRPTCPGAFARCTSAIPMGMSSGSAAARIKQNRSQTQLRELATPSKRCQAPPDLLFYSADR